MSRSKTTQKTKINIQTPKNTRKTNRPAKIISIVIVCVAMLLVVLALFILPLFSEENITKTKIDRIAADYYKNTIYKSIVHSRESTETSNFEDIMKHYTEKGFAHIYLRQILLSDNNYQSKDSDFLRDVCDENKTAIQFFPEPPYNEKSYHTKITYSCNF